MQFLPLLHYFPIDFQIPAVDHLHVFVVVTEQFRPFQVVHGIPAIAEDVGERVSSAQEVCDERQTAFSV